MAVKKRQIRHEKLCQHLNERPFSTDEDLARLLDVSVSTIRLDRTELGIPELRERTKEVAHKAHDTLKTLGEQEFVGKLLELKMNDHACSQLLIDEGMVLAKAKVARGHHLFAQANSLAVALVDAEMALTGSAQIKFIRPVKLGEVVKAEAKVTKREGNRYWIRVKANVFEDEVMNGEWVVFSF